MKVSWSYCYLVGVFSSWLLLILSILCVKLRTVRYELMSNYSLSAKIRSRFCVVPGGQQVCNTIVGLSKCSRRKLTSVASVIFFVANAVAIMIIVVPQNNFVVEVEFP
jgi:hypothetical protein